MHHSKFQSNLMTGDKLKNFQGLQIQSTTHAQKKLQKSSGQPVVLSRKNEKVTDGVIGQRLASDHDLRNGIERFQIGAKTAINKK